ncbi:MAG: serine/threonine protein kinase [Deltaproteobacteria bacterium]|nr:serine/threonine protein kinase [Deltaproteobacteria bacterium]
MVALAALGAGVLVPQRTRQAAEADLRAKEAAQAQAEAADAAEQLSQQVSALETSAKGMASSIPFKAALTTHNLATVRGQIEEESTFDELRPLFPILGVVTGEDDTYVRGAGLGSLNVGTLLQRGQVGPASGVVFFKGAPYAAAVAPVQVPPAQEHPRPSVAVALLAKPLETASLASLNRRAGTALVLSDGAHPLLAAGPAEAVETLHKQVGRETEPSAVDPALRWSAGAKPVAPGIWLWVLMDESDVANEALATVHATELGVWIGAGVLALAGLAFGFLGGRKPVPGPTTADELNRTAVSQPRVFIPAGLGTDDTAPGGQHGNATQPGWESTLPPQKPIALTQPTGPNEFGRYRLVSLLGSGGMGDVYMAVAFGAEGFRRNFVVKRLRPELARDPIVVTHFVDEARLSSSLVHSNIIPVFDFGKVGDEYFMAQEYINGRDLERITSRSMELEGKPLPLNLVFYAVHQVLQALAYAHAKSGDDGTPLNLVHRDVSPQNVMVSSRGEVKLFDFGIVKSAARQTKTEAGVVKGNVSFMSPEQARGLEIDQRADLFSLGLVMYRCLTGEMLYRDETSYQMLVHAATGPGVADLSRIAQLPQPAPAILSRALAVDPTQRFANAQEFAAALPPTSQADAAELGAVVERLFGSDLEGERAKLAGAGAASNSDPRLRGTAT